MERLFLVGILTKYDDKVEKIASLEELASLGKTAGGEVVEKILQHREKPHPAFFIGKGKAVELKEIGEQLKIDTFIFDEELTGTQVRNLEEITGRKVIDRTELILDIFAKHAHTRAAKIEVELTQLKYRLSRLTGKGIALSRLGGGIGTRGPGERKLEIDRRRIRKRIQIMEKRLKEVEISKEIQSKQRKPLLRCALVGYTNAGKSTILNQLTHSNVPVEDKLFSTLDSTTRKLVLLPPNNTNSLPPLNILITDTIGFLRKLPHGLISSFKSTLQEAVESDLRLHVIDISHPNWEAHLFTGNQILENLQVGEKPMIYIFNKIDLSPNPLLIEQVKKTYPNSVFISATKKKGLLDLKKVLWLFFSTLYQKRKGCFFPKT